MDDTLKNSKRILALDYGSKRIGVALSDELGLTAQPLVVIKRSSAAADFAEIRRIVSESGASMVVVGMPFNMDGTAGPQAERVRSFISRLTDMVGVPVREWDERLSTVAVTRVLIEGDVSRHGRKLVVDKLSASFILQGYLDSLSREGTEGL